MKELNLKALYEPLSITIGETTVEAVVDVTADNLIAISEASMKCKDDMALLDKLKAKAERSRDTKAIKEFSIKTAKVLEKTVCTCIGAEAYNEIIEACGGGSKITKSACNEVMGHVLLAILDIIKEHAARQEELNEKAAYYLSEVVDAQTEPYAE